MLAEVIHDLVVEFDQQQGALIEAIGGQLKGIVAGIAKNKAMNHGKPPYIVDTGDVSLLFVEKDGTYSKLAPDFSLTEENTSDDFDVIYSLPVPGIGVVRFIPVRAGVKAPPDYQSNFTPSAYDDQFLAGLSQYLQVMVDTIPQLAALRMAKKLIQVQPAMERSAEDAEMELTEFMELREVRDAIVEILGQALVEGAKRASEMVIEARKEKA